jgi:hypothetical protein
MGDTSTKSRYFINDWYLGQIFSLYTCNYGFIYLQILVSNVEAMKISTINQDTRIVIQLNICHYIKNCMSIR